jgi:SAM-dependent methyltransferase
MNISISRLKALADATRIRILGLLREEELSVGEITAVLGMAQSRVSAHLGVLREARLVRDRREGTSVFYTLADGDPRKTWEAVLAADPSLGPADGDRRRLATVRRRRRERSREFFDRVAERWDAGRSESLGLHAGSLALAGLLPRDVLVLDLGTGTGPLLPLLGRHLDRVFAVDGSRGMLARARARVKASGAGSVRLLRADVEALPLPDGSVDGVIANMILHHLPEPASLFLEIARVLRPGGRGVAVDFEPHDASWLIEEEGHRWPGFEGETLRGWCKAAGLSDPEFEQAPTPRSGRWASLNVFVARFERAAAPRNGRGVASPGTVRTARTARTVRKTPRRARRSPSPKEK